jgi:hypothetical protein
MKPRQPGKYVCTTRRSVRPYHLQVPIPAVILDDESMARADYIAL